MSKLKEVTVYENNRKLKPVNPISLPESFPPLSQIYEITLVDHNGTPYVFRLLKDKPEPTADALDGAIECENLSIDLIDIKEIFMKLTDDQRNIVMHIYYIYKNKQNVKQNDIGEVSEENPKIILQGPAGTGKSTIINFIEKLITWEENKTSDTPEKLKVLKCAFTGKAASNIDGLTLNYMFSIPIYKTRNLTKKRLDSKKQLLENCIFFICDEISMVGEKLMNSVNMRLQQVFDNDKVYGNRFVLLVGDLYQIDPVRRKPMYHPKSQLWACCDFYELNKIIRQQDENFINALNNFRDSQMTEEDINLFESRKIQDINQVPDSVIHLFFRNPPVDEYNNKKIDKSNEKEEIVNTFKDNDKWSPANLRVKIGIRYMIIYNMDVGDGLANGTTGVVKGFDYDEHGCVDVIWMEFHSNTIGKKTKSDYFKKHNKPGFEDWVPIHRSNVIVKLTTNPKVSRTVGNMFPLKAAEAITVHKSQGQTYHDGVCLHFTDHKYDRLRTDKSLQYVALTRVKRLEDLYIIGTFNFTNMDSKKFIRTTNELNRLRTERKLKLAYETFDDKTSDVIIFLNTQLTFNDHHEFITTDKWYGNGSLLIFTETNTIVSDKIEIPNFEIVFRSDDETTVRSGGGVVCYKKTSKFVEVISSLKNENDESKTYLTLLLYEKLIYIITGDTESVSEDQFKRGIMKFMNQFIQDNRCICFIGNIKSSKTPPLTDFLNDFNFKTKLSFDIATTNEETRCDIILTRNLDIQDDQIGFYAYIPSSHRPIYVKLAPVSELMKSHGELNTADYEKVVNLEPLQFSAEDMDTDMDSDKNADTDSDSDTNSDTDTDSDTNVGRDSDSDTNKDSDKDSDTEMDWDSNSFDIMWLTSKAGKI